MAYPQVLIPPSVKPVSPMEFGPADDQTVQFRPRFARGTTQRQLWGDPLWSAQVRYESLSGADRAIMRAVLSAVRGGACNILMTPGIAPRGSFPATELLTNNDFRNGTTGWSAQNVTLSSADNVLRARPTWASTNPGAYQTVTLAANIPYVGRSFGDSTFSGIKSLYFQDAAAVAASLSSTDSPILKSVVLVPTTAGAGSFFPNYISSSSGWTVSDALDVFMASVARCILSDSGPNALTYSDQLDNAAWGSNAVTITANATAAPDGTTTADGVTETVANTSHYIYHTAPPTSAVAADYCAFVMVKQGASDRDLRVAVGNTGAGNYGECVFDLSAGTAGTPAAGGTVTNPRAFITSMGNGWYACCVVARCPASLAVGALFQMYNAGASSYAGSGGSLYLWRGGVAQSSFPTRSAQTTSAATSGASQTGSSLYVKGLPVSTNGLLLAGDFFEINGELKRCTASLDSDAAGLGVLKFAPSLNVAAADNDPIIVLNPMGRFTLAQDPRISERFGVYTDVDLALIEASSA